MPGEKDLSKLLATMEPALRPGDYVFCTVTNLADLSNGNVSLSLIDIVMYFREAEGITLILEKQQADRLELTYEYVAAWITLTVHSSLAAVGLTAAFSTALAEAGISCNVVAGYYHDHIFVARADAERAMQVLHGFAN